MTDIIDHNAKVLEWICLRYRSDQNFKKWVQINSKIANEFEVIFDKLNNFLDPDMQSGLTLDTLGKFVGLYPRPSYVSGNDRIVVNDELYRMLIKAKSLKNSGDATIDNICNAVEYVTGFKVKKIDDLQNMTYQLVFEGYLSDEAKLILDNFDILPRPQCVKFLGYRVEIDEGFGYDGELGRLRPYDDKGYNS